VIRFGSTLFRLDLLGDDVGMASVPGGFGDHAQVDESQAYGADDVVFDDVIECEASYQFVRLSTCCSVFGDHLGEGFIVGDVEVAVASDGVAVACVGGLCLQVFVETRCVWPQRSA
jgi:hypothetical protein